MLFAKKSLTFLSAVNIIQSESPQLDESDTHIVYFLRRLAQILQSGDNQCKAERKYNPTWVRFLCQKERFHHVRRQNINL